MTRFMIGYFLAFFWVGSSVAIYDSLTMTQPNTVSIFRAISSVILAPLYLGASTACNTGMIEASVCDAISETVKAGSAK